jgi:hypothetical protein
VGAGVLIQHKRKASDFVPGELQTAELGLNTSIGRWQFSQDGSTVTTLDRPNNASVADQTINANSSALLTGSLVTIPAGKLRIGTVFHFRVSFSKTAAGTAANTFIFRLGTNGTIADPAILTFTMPTATAAADQGDLEIVVTIRGPLSGSCIAQGFLSMRHNLASTGLATIPNVVLKATSSTFDATAANLKASLSCSTAVSTVLTFQQVIAEVRNV